MERAFAGPRLLADRLGVQTLSAADIAGTDDAELVRAFQGPPAVHRYPGSMASRTQELCRLLVERYDGRAEVSGPTRRTAPPCCSGSGSCPASARRRRGSSSRCSASSTA